MQKALVTGASGFLGKYIVQHLKSQFVEVHTLARHNADLVFDLSRQIPVIPNKYDLVVHAAGKAHIIPKTAEEEKEFFLVNAEGTKNLCYAFDTSAQWPGAFVFISTVSVYGVEAGENINEEHSLLGATPYAKSKIEAEHFLTGWCAEHHVKLSILRLPLIAGANPPGNLGAMIKGISNNHYFNIGKGTARKTIVMADDVAKWIPVVATTGGIYNLGDGYHPSFAQLAELMARQLGKKPPSNIPQWLATCIAFAGNFLGSKAPVNSDKLRKITATLTFDDSRARKAFGWKPVKVLDAFTLN